MSRMKVEIELLVERRIYRGWRADQKKRVAIRGRAHNGLSPDIGAGAGATLDDEGLAQSLLERLTQQPRHDVGTASGREGYDHVHGSVRLGLRLRGAWEGREHSSTCCKLQKPAAWKVHCCLPSRGGVGGIGILAPLCVECGLL